MSRILSLVVTTVIAAVALVAGLLVGNSRGVASERDRNSHLPTPTPFVVVHTRTIIANHERIKVVKVRVVRTVVKVVKVPVVSTVVKIVRVMVAAPTVTPTVVAPDAVLIRTSGTDNKQTNTFTADGPFTLSWDARKTDTSGLFSVELHSASGQELDLPVNTTDPGRDNTIEHADCSSGCYLKITSNTVTYSIVAQLGTNPTAAAALPTLTPTPPAGLSASVDASDPAVQAVLQFAPACTNVTVNSDSIATRVEQQEGLNTYIGSNSYPGTFTKQGAANGATTVTWHLPSHQLYGTYQFKISQDTSHMWFINDAAYSISC